MSRPTRNERLAAKGRPKRRAAKTHFFRYQLTTNPGRTEENDLKRALEESLKEQNSIGGDRKAKSTSRNSNLSNSNNDSIVTNHLHTNNSDVTSSNKSSSSNSSNDVTITSIISANSKRTRSGTNLNYLKLSPPNNKRARLDDPSFTSLSPSTNGHHRPGKCDDSLDISYLTPPPAFTRVNQASLRTYSRKSSASTHNHNQRASSVIQRNSQSPTINKDNPSAEKDRRPSPGNSLDDCSFNVTQDLSEKRLEQGQVKIMIKNRCTPGSWSLLGVPEEKIVSLRNDEPPRRLICYPAIKHVEGDVIQVRDSVLLRSGAKKTDLPYIAKICAFWEDAETGNIMMSLLWYYRPEHTEEGRRPHHLTDEIFASRHRDIDSVECIEDKCYVLTFNEYCRYRKRCKMEQASVPWSLSDVTIPVSNEPYPRGNRIPDSNVNPELVFCCRQIYDSRVRRLVKNPLISPKYGHI